MEREWDYAALSPARGGRAACRRRSSCSATAWVPACPFLSRLGEGLRVAPASHAAPSAAVVGQLGHAMLAAGDTTAAETLEPLYLRPSEAELKARRP